MLKDFMTRLSAATAILGVSLTFAASGAAATTIDVVRTVLQSGFSGMSASPIPLTGSGGWFFFPPVTGGTIVEVAINMVLIDGDTDTGEFDFDDITFGLDGFDTGIELNGFESGETTSLFFPFRGITNAAAITAALFADNRLVGTLIDADPNDNDITIPNMIGTRNIGTSLHFRFLLVPEPGTLALFGLGLAGLGLARRRRRL